MAENNYDDLKVNEKDSRLTDITKDEQAAVNASNKTYQGILNSANKEFDKQTGAVNKWEEQQTKLQNEQTDFAIEKINQQKEWAQQDYTKEQSGAWTDYQKQSAQHGVNAEQMAMQGMTGTGYSESSLVSMYNTYQNRVATARESFNRAVVEYDNMITEAKLQNNAALAEIANNALQKRLEISMNAFQYKNTLLLEKAKAAREIKDSYWNRYATMYGYIQDELKTQESARQFDEQMEETIRHNKAAEVAAKNAHALEMKKFEWQKQQAKKSSSGGSGGGSSGGSGGGSGSIKKSSSKNNTPKTSGTVKKASKNKPDIKQMGTHETTDSNTKYTVDMDSVLALGYGPISESKLAKLVAGGDVKKYVENGKIKFKKTYETAGFGSAGRLVRRFE